MTIIKRGSTHFLRLAIFLIGIGVLAFCLFVLPDIWGGGSPEYPLASRAAFLIMIGMYITALPFFAILWQALKLLGYIDQNKAFSDLSVKALKTIKQCATIITILYMGGVPLLFPIADVEDAPGLLIIGAIIACAPMVVAVFAAILQRLLQNAIDIQSENELTV